MRGLGFIKTAAAAGVLAVAMLGSAERVDAATITATLAGPPPITKTVEITCTGVCEFWDLGLAAFSATSGSWLSGPTSNSNTDRRDFVESVLGFDPGLQTESTDTTFGVPLLSATLGEAASWTSSALYFLAWGGPDPRYILIRNGTANNEFIWNATGQGSGLSGVDGFGVIPLPAAGWLLLGGLGALGAVARRKRRKAA